MRKGYKRANSYGRSTTEDVLAQTTPVETENDGDSVLGTDKEEEELLDYSDNHIDWIESPTEGDEKMKRHLTLLLVKGR